MTPERAAEILDDHFDGVSAFDARATTVSAILAACAEERKAALTEAAEMLDRAQQPAAIVNAAADERERDQEPR